MNNSIRVGVFLASPFAKVPDYGSEESACFDMRACIKDVDHLTVYRSNNEKINVPVVLGQTFVDDVVTECHSIVVRPHERLLVPTGLIFDIPEGYSIRLHPRSGLSLKYGIVLQNCEAVIDSDFVHQTQLMIVNNSEKSFVFSHGDRLCQGEVVKDLKVGFDVIDTAPDQRTSRNGGLGHTGVK
jgi:dUTP pyrophosphatase